MYYDRLTDLGIKLSRRGGNEKTKCPQCSDGRKNKNDKPLSVNITNGEYNCFSIETKVITRDGVFPIGDILGKPVLVLDGYGDWQLTFFKKYGTEKLYEISLSRNGHTKKIYATANHRWFVRSNVFEVETKDLLNNQRLRSVFSKKTSVYKIVSEGVQHGFVFGDGSLENKHRNSRAYFCGDKDEEMFQYFPSNNPVYISPGRVAVGHLPKKYKYLPFLEEDNNYLFSWLAGYFSADGDVAENGLAIINSAKKENLEFIRVVCNKIGIGTYSISEYERNGFGGVSKIFRLSFVSSTLTENFFLLSKHKDRFNAFNKIYERTRWVVKEVKETNIIEDVYCCEVGSTGSFVLEDNILTGNCHNCGWKGNVRAFERKRDTKKYEKPPQDVLRNIELKSKIIDWFKQRGISEKTLNKFLIFSKEEFMPQSSEKESCVCFPYLRDGEIVNIKYRSGLKHFKMHKDAELIFFNLPSISERKSCIITEGEIDCMSLFECGFGVDKEISEEGEWTNEFFSKYAVLSVPNGASKGNQKLEYLDNCSDWLIGLDEIIIATDGDEPGKSLADELIRRIGVERCRIVSYPIEEVVPLDNGLKRRCKDFNEVLCYIGESSVISCIKNSEQIPVDGIYYVEDIFPSMLDNFRRGVQLSPPTRFAEMDEYFRWKKGEINMFVGYGNHGKSFFVLQLMLTKSIWDGWRWAIFSPENYPANDFYDDLIEMYTGKWLDKMTEDEYSQAAHFLSEHIFYVYPDDGHDIHSINEKFRYLVLKKGIDGVLVDPLNQLDHLQKPYQREDQYLSELYKDIKRFALLNNVSYNIIAHPKNPTYNSDKSLPVVDMYDIAGGAMSGNKMDNIISYHRPRFHEDKNSPEVQVYIQKLKRKRTGGKLGDFPMVLVWSKKRYSNPVTGEMPCDPNFAKYEKAQITENVDRNLWLPYKDDNQSEIGF